MRTKDEISRYIRKQKEYFVVERGIEENFNGVIEENLNEGVGETLRSKRKGIQRNNKSFMLVGEYTMHFYFFYSNPFYVFVVIVFGFLWIVYVLFM